MTYRDRAKLQFPVGDPRVAASPSDINSHHCPILPSTYSNSQGCCSPARQARACLAAWYTNRLSLACSLRAPLRLRGTMSTQYRASASEQRRTWRTIPQSCTTTLDRRCPPVPMRPDRCFCARCFAAAPAVRPALLVFHEPTSAVDPQMVGEALSIMEDLQREDTSMLIGTRNALCA
jgi:hypothetical protein